MEQNVCDFYKKIAKRNQAKENILATVIDGPHIGEKIYFCGSTVVCALPEEGFLANIDRAFLESVQNGRIEADGEQIFCEQIRNHPLMVICGGGHVSIPVIRLAKMTGFQVTVLEDRRQFADYARNAGADQVICKPFPDAMAQINGTPDTYFVIVTRGHRYDTICLRAAIQKPHAYIGMMGSRKRTGLVKQQLAAEGIAQALLEQVHTPIGLPIGAQTPEEIAVSVLAEIIQKKNGYRQHAAFTSFSGEMLAYLTGEQGAGIKKVLSMIVFRKGSAPREVGTKMLILEDAKTVGTIGGGYAEHAIVRAALGMMQKDEKHKLMQVDMTGKEAEDAGMVCGGTMEVYLELL